ncbi:MAG: isoprenylcysteine carboxylmethyltransferase family protein [Chloroflexi bacterium]|nr:isoprenylcysteine carboxylmethyltransferase family protein [Chloroflexota bacterium]
MSEHLALLIAGLFFVVFAVFSLWYLQKEYQQRGKLSWRGSAVHVTMFAVNGMFVALSAWGPNGVPPMTGLAWLGVPLMVVGAGIVVYAMDMFRKFSRWLGNDTPGLATSGLYSLSRNPQFVGYGLLILGVVVAWGRATGWIGLLSYFALAYFTARVEEEHLTRVYGQSYRDYCSRAPRFIGLPQKGK